VTLSIEAATCSKQEMPPQGKDSSELLQTTGSASGILSQNTT